mgnify:CR=1 FL=1
MGSVARDYMKQANPAEIMKLFNGGIYLSPTTRCNARCRHCITREEDLVFIDADFNKVMDWIDQIHECGINGLHFVGGEPFLVRDHLTRYIQKASELGIYTSVVTNAYWAKTLEDGIAVLKEMPGLDIIIISSDKYHLEFIDSQTVINAIEAGLATNKFVVMNTTYVEKSELNEIQELYKAYKDTIIFQVVKAMPFPGPDAEKIVHYPYFQMPNRVPKFCGIGNYFIDANGAVYACCQGSRSENTKYLMLGDLNQERLPDMDKRLKQNPVYRYIKKHGPRGLVTYFADSKYADALYHKEFAGACDICHELLDNKEMYEYFLQGLGAEFS